MRTFDRLSRFERSRLMSSIKGKNTKPELVVRAFLRSRNQPYSLHGKRLPGKPDIVLKPLKKLIFINGCFWHQHSCETYSIPRTNRKFWADKLRKNKIRDRRVLRKIRKLGWSCKTIWECQLRRKRINRTFNGISRFLKR